MAFLHTIQTQRTDVNERYGMTKDPSPLRGFKTPAPVLILLSCAQTFDIRYNFHLIYIPRHI